MVEGMQCKVFNCDHARGRRCCAECEKKCSRRCLNDPHKCGLAEQRAPEHRRAAYIKATTPRDEGEGGIRYVD